MQPLSSHSLFRVTLSPRPNARSPALTVPATARPHPTPNHLQGPVGGKRRAPLTTRSLSRLGLSARRGDQLCCPPPHRPMDSFAAAADPATAWLVPGEAVPVGDHWNDPGFSLSKSAQIGEKKKKREEKVHRNYLPRRGARPQNRALLPVFHNSRQGCKLWRPHQRGRGCGGGEDGRKGCVGAAAASCVRAPQTARKPATRPVLSFSLSSHAQAGPPPS